MKDSVLWLEHHICDSGITLHRHTLSSHLIIAHLSHHPMKGFSGDAQIACGPGDISVVPSQGLTDVEAPVLGEGLLKGQAL
ncbi:MAG: hypothetical protein BWY92_01103 [Firmicutes bacterium ADurb.BinA052]|nr:MAG: hypothetical protein BWY92_01103 [Firmicutes bacterium ADurb.BinA052]